MTTTQAPVVRTTPRTTTRTLLTAGLVAGPLYTAVWLGQAATREGFDITRHPASLLANGGPGWIQSVNFVLAALLTVAAAVGLHRSMSGRGSRWAPRLLGAYGVGLLLAAIFPADPGAGFPVGTPGDHAEISARGMGHFVAGTIGFTGLIAACLVMAAYYRSTGQTGWARYSTVTGVLFFGAFAGLMAGAGKPVTITVFGVAVVLGWSWIAAICAQHRRTT
ncbi:DUF998 domain-containing protein [Kribbella sp. CA-293567]|uniref:DUF998 domain-containing protein n=1 Tax=Kribbella sp. CA-293567 TaxID=3002436 RepID=UPI0022DE4CA5|nr:DUF998 domain-containing protein [Kribbella sp. CA-293567]WBQ08446.1 DUF998 domain-containing protein [Kribbella sp. CA-293567]